MFDVFVYLYILIYFFLAILYVTCWF